MGKSVKPAITRTRRRERDGVRISITYADGDGKNEALGVLAKVVLRKYREQKEREKCARQSTSG